MESVFKPESRHDLHLQKISERSDDDMRATVDGARHNTIHRPASCVVKIVRAALTAWMLMFGMLQARS